MVFCPNQVHTQDVKQLASDWLIQNLSLKTHSTNNIIVSANSGLKFLGHRIYADSITIDKNNSRKVAQLSSTDDLASYSAMNLSEKQQKLLLWRSLTG